MQRRIVRLAALAAIVALVTFALPLGVLARSWFIADEVGELERAALPAALRVGPGFDSGDPVELPAAEPGATLAIYDLGLGLRAGDGPSAPSDAPTRDALTGIVSSDRAGGELIVAVPVSAEERVIGVVRTAVPMRVVWTRTAIAWVAEAALATVALAIALVAARRAARRLSEPLEELAAASERVVGGDLAARCAPSEIPEIARAADAQNAMVERLAGLLDRAHRFRVNASHQLRTLLTGIGLGIEAALEDPRADLRKVLVRTRSQVARLHDTVDQVTMLARGESGPLQGAQLAAVRDVAGSVERDFHARAAGAGRRIRVSGEPGAQRVLVPRWPVQQVLEVLFDNALRHGRGLVRVELRELCDALAVDVSDEGSLLGDPRSVFDRGVSGADGAGIGLALAREITEVMGGRLTLTSADPTRFTLVAPAPVEDSGESGQVQP